MLARGGKIDPQMIIATDSAGMLEFLLKQNININTRDIDGETALHSAADAGSLARMKILIHHGAAINIKDNDGKTPLHHVSENHYIDQLKAAKLLIAAGARVNSQDKDGQTPLHLVADWYGGDPEYAKYLLEHGAITSIRDIKGRRPLDVAKQSNNEIANVIRQYSIRRN